VNRLLEAGYDTRGQLVHGAARMREIKPNKPGGYSGEDFLAKCHDPTRRILGRFADAALDAKGFESFINELDQQILR